MWNLVPQPGIETVPPTLEVLTTRLTKSPILSIFASEFLWSIIRYVSIYNHFIFLLYWTFY